MVLFWVLTGTCASAFGQDNRQLSIPAGETEIFPSVRIDYQENSNAFLTPVDETTSTGYVVAPSVIWVADRRLFALKAEYSGAYSTNTESELDYGDHSITLESSAEFSKRIRVSGSFSFDHAHEALGTRRTRGQGEQAGEQILFNDIRLNGKVVYGTDGARGNIELGMGLHRRVYADQSQFINDLTRNDDLGEALPYALFSLRISPDTRATAEIRYGNFTFSGGDQDRSDISALAGLSFNPTGKFGGSVKLGTTFADYSSSAREDTSVLIAEADLRYLPVSYSEFELSFIRQLDNLGSQPTSNDGLQSVSDDARLSWVHNWSSRIFHRANVSLSTVDRGCPDPDTMTSAAGIEFNFRLRRWLEVGAGVNSVSRTADICTDADNLDDDLDYERQIIGFHIRATL